jgi:hypothetical protein
VTVSTKNVALLAWPHKENKMHFTPLPYLDPGSGSFIIQIAIAAILGLAVAIRASWGSIKKYFGVKPKPEEEEEEDNNDSDNV